MKHIASKLKDPNFMFSRQYLQDSSYLVPPPQPTHLPVQRSVPALHIQRYDTKKKESSKQIGSPRKRGDSIPIHVSPPPLRRQESMRAVHSEEKRGKVGRASSKQVQRVESDFITINKIATQLASSVRKNFKLGQSDVNKYIMQIQKTERGLLEEKLRHKQLGNIRVDRDMVMWSKGMEHLKKSRDSSIASLEEHSQFSS